jgi:hypothetical protein
VSRLISIVALVALLSTATAATVAAARPQRIALSAPSTFVMPADLACEDFDVLFETIAFKEIATSWEKRDGSFVQHVTGRYQIRLTNLDSGAWIRTSIAGPTLIRVSADGTVTVKGTGTWGFWFPGEHPFFTSGRVDPFIGGNEATLATLQGHWSDICALLA